MMRFSRNQASQFQTILMPDQIFEIRSMFEIDYVKSSMRNRSGTCGRAKRTLPLEGGGRRVGVKGLTGVARTLRKRSTDTERHLWKCLRDRQIEGFKFRRHQPVGSYVVDFVNLEKKLVIELDGGQHALHPGDRIRDDWLRAEG